MSICRRLTPLERDVAKLRVKIDRVDLLPDTATPALLRGVLAGRGIQAV